MKNVSLIIFTMMFALLVNSTNAQTVAKFTVSAQGSHICQGSQVWFNNTTTTTNNPSKLSYQWYFTWLGSTQNWNLANPPAIVFNSGAPKIELLVFDSVANVYSYFDTTLTVWPQPYIQSLVPQSPSIVCSGDSVTMTATPSITANMSWYRDVNSNPSIAGTSQSFITKTGGQYFVRATTPQGCQSPAYYFFVSQNAPMSVELGTWLGINLVTDDTISICSNVSQQIFTVTTNGYYPFSYSWNGLSSSTTSSLVPTGPGTYSVSVEDANGCMDTDTIEVVFNHPPVDSVAVSDYSPCMGDTVVIIAGPGNTYLWSNGSTNDSIEVFYDGYFSVVIEDTNGCSTATTPLQLTFAQTPDPIVKANGCYLAISKVTSGSQYQWYFEGVPIVGQTKQFVTATKKGYYSVLETNTGGCSMMSAVEFADCTPAGIPNTKGLAGVKMYPSPFTSSFTVAIEEKGNYIVELFNTNGQKVLSTTTDGREVINAQTLPSGLYMVTVSDGEYTTRKRIVKI